MAAGYKQTLLQGAGEKMVVLRGGSSQQLRALQLQAEQCGLPVHMVGIHATLPALCTIARGMTTAGG